MSRFLKPLLIGIIALVVVMLAFSLVLPRHVMTSKWVRVHADKDSILHMVKDLNGWRDWNDLLSDASDIRTGDSSIEWTSARGPGNRITVQGISDIGISTEIRLNGSRPLTSGFSIEKKDPAVDSVQVVWYIVEELRWYPWEKFYGMMAADMKGPLMQSSLYRLKAKLEK